MKTIYRNCEIEVFRDKCLGGWDMLFYSIFDNGYEVDSGFTEEEETVRNYIKILKNRVDEYYEMLEERESNENNN